MNIEIYPNVHINQSRDPKRYTYQSSDPKGRTYQSSDPEGCTYQSSDPEGCTYQSSDPEGHTYQSSDPLGHRAYVLKQHLPTYPSKGGLSSTKPVVKPKNLSATPLTPIRNKRYGSVLLHEVLVKTEVGDHWGSSMAAGRNDVARDGGSHTTTMEMPSEMLTDPDLWLEEEKKKGWTVAVVQTRRRAKERQGEFGLGLARTRRPRSAEAVDSRQTREARLLALNGKEEGRGSKMVVTANSVCRP
ncbi:NBS-LRR type resistance protein [Cucumis melo var. makuwa]|uniref:NBS-LRR type resistance protein n=1 Tax=Cucumis melo var. makuwa TaxID=1194695 RepID=A0A5D3DF34_CUCMM|nr:NBS-LRR type resistance protein [Cucumis melo var. makuwa]